MNTLENEENYRIYCLHDAASILNLTNLSLNEADKLMRRYMMDRNEPEYYLSK